MIDWSHLGAVVTAAFLASLVEFIEALTIVLAVAMVRGRKPAFLGAGAAVLLLAALVVILGPLLSQLPISWLQLVVGAFLLLFGMRWLRKAVLRAAGVMARHDEAEIFDKKTKSLQRDDLASGPWDLVAIATSFKAVLLEGLEVIFVVIAIGSVGGMLVPAALGAGAALFIVIGVALMIHRPLARIPENILRFAVGVLLSGFGGYWIGKGAGLVWPGGDWAIVGVIVGFLITALLAVQLARRSMTASLSSTNQLSAAIGRFSALFVDDARFVVVIALWVVFASLALPNLPLQADWNALPLLLGCAVILLVSTWRPTSS